MTKLLGRGLVKCCLKTTTQSIRCRGWWVPLLNLIIVLLFFAQVLICDVLTLADAGLIPEEVDLSIERKLFNLANIIRPGEVENTCIWDQRGGVWPQHGILPLLPCLPKVSLRPMPNAGTLQFLTSCNCFTSFTCFTTG